MKKQPVAAVINFCSNESRFIGACIEEARKFAKQIVIPVCDHFFDGMAENRTLLDQIYRAYPDCLFLEYPFIPSEIPRRIFKDVSPAHFWHSCSRLIGASFLDKSIETIVFLDADEIPEGAKFAEWLETSDYHHNTVMKLSNYWYFREPIYQALAWEDSIVLVQVRAVSRDLLLRQGERDAIYDLLPGPKRRHVTGPDGQPMFHHFSWVRTKEEMLKKVKSWGHKSDRNWIDLVEKEFSAPFQGTDFIHGYQYKAVAPLFDIRLGATAFEDLFPEGKRFSSTARCGKFLAANHQIVRSDPPLKSRDCGEQPVQPANNEPRVIRLTQKDLRDLLKFKKNVVWSWLSSLIK